MSGTTGSGSTNAGPHGSNLANKLDPRVDSDLDGSATVGSGPGNRNPGQSGIHGSSQTVGPHSTDIGNKLDPRVDSDNSRGLAGNTGTGYSGTTGTTGMTGTTGTTRTTGMTGTTATGAGLTGAGTTGTGHHHGHHGAGGVGGVGNTFPGPAPNTAGPHKSDLLNKLDPRVDSDLDGSKTL